MALGPSPFIFGSLAIVIVVAAILHRISGQGFGTVTAPFVALFAPDHMPATVLLLGAMVTSLGVGIDFRDVKLREISPAILGRFLGTIPAVWLVGLVAGSSLLGLSVAAMILLAVALSLAGITVAKTPTSLLAAGGLSGFMGTLTSVGAAPLGLIYQNDEAKVARPTLNAYFLLGVVFSIGGLALGGLMRAEHLLTAAALSPFILLGVWLARPLARRTERSSLKVAALCLASFAAILLIVRSLG
ncbi:MAG: sulfite exporter TauE/SafE family protein [Pseudomonadota bacterium]